MEVAGKADLVDRLSAADPSAFEEAFRSYAPRCRAVARRILQDAAAAEDAVQDAFVALWRHRDGLVVRAAGIGPWLVVVTRNAALATVRSSSRRRAREDAAAPAGDAAGDPADASMRAADIKAALSTLPDEQRTVLDLAYFGGLTLAKVAERTGAPLGTVKRRAQLALARLAKTLGDDR